MRLPPPPNLEALPAPVALLKAVHWLAEVAYAVPMSLALGWPLMTLAAEAVGAGRGDTSLRRLAAWIARRTPGAVTFTLILAFPPFLLGQALYGEAWLPAEQRMGWLWFAVIPLAFTASGAAFWVALRRRGTEPSTLRPFLPEIAESYLLAFRRRGLERPGLLLTLIAAASLLALGFAFTIHAILAATPAASRAAGGALAAGGLPLRDPQLLPRLLHTLLGAFAVSGLFVAWHGADRVADGEAGYGRTALKFGALWLVVSTALQGVAGPWFLFSLPPDATRQFLGASPRYTLALWTGAGCGFAAALLTAVSLLVRDPRWLVRPGAALLAGSVAAMTGARQHLRAQALGASLGIGAPPAAPQHGMLVLFSAAAALTAVVLLYMVWAASLPRRARNG